MTNFQQRVLEFLANFVAQLQTVLNYRLFTIKDNPISLTSVLLFLFVIWVSLQSSKYLRYLFERRFSRRFRDGLDFTMKRLIHYVVLGIGFFVALEMAGVDLSSLALVAGALGVGVGFGLQNVTSNFVSGLILLFERPIKVGDMVTVEDELGTIETIKLRATTVKTLDNIDIIIPNSSFIEQNVINWSYGEEKIRLRCPVGVAYGSDTEKVAELLQQVALEHEDVMDDPEPRVLFREFGDSALNFELIFWIDTPQHRPRILSDVNFAIDRTFRENDVEIPFPQRDVHFRRSDAEVPVRVRSDGAEDEVEGEAEEQPSRGAESTPSESPSTEAEDSTEPSAAGSDGNDDRPS